MKVLVINTVRFKLNGISAVIMSYFKAMNASDLQIEFVAIEEPAPEYAELFEQDGITCHVLHKSKLISYFFALVRLARKGRYDIVHIHGNSATLALEILACCLAESQFGLHIPTIHQLYIR